MIMMVVEVKRVKILLFGSPVRLTDPNVSLILNLVPKFGTVQSGFWLRIRDKTETVFFVDLFDLKEKGKGSNLDSGSLWIRSEAKTSTVRCRSDHCPTQTINRNDNGKRTYSREDPGGRR